MKSQKVNLRHRFRGQVLEKAHLTRGNKVLPLTVCCRSYTAKNSVCIFSFNLHNCVRRVLSQFINVDSEALEQCLTEFSTKMEMVYKSALSNTVMTGYVWHLNMWLSN